jgi:hypothetical protein
VAWIQIGEGGQGHDSYITQEITEEKKNVIYEHVYCVLMAARLYVIIKPI